jgi:probable rRNA maturation factor
MNTDSGIEIQCAIIADGLPSSTQLHQWLQHALQDRAADSELTLRIVDEAEITALNQRYRGKDGATNVLSFPYQPLPGVESGLLGDIVICAPVVAREAVAQDISLKEHWAHITIHGVLHLLGHDHQEAEEAGRMERQESQLLGQLGFTDPYQPHVE